MRVATVLVDCDDRLVVAGSKVLAAEGLHDPLLHVVLGRSAVASASANFLKCRSCNGVDLVACLEMRANLFFCQGCFKICDEITRADDLMSEAANQLDRAGIHQPNVENEIIGRI